MNRHIFITLLVVWGALCIGANAQTPYDAFAPETSRPMLGLDVINMMENPSQCNVINDSVWSTKSSVDNVSKWLSVDPLSDKYPSISPYAYCNWNPVKYVDPDGRTYVINTNGKTEKIDDGKDNHVVLNANNSRERVEIDLTKGKILEKYADENTPENVNLLRMENMDVAIELYEAMGKNVSMLEFNVLSAHSEEENFYYVGNTQESHSTGIGNFVFCDLGQTIDYMKHFHPTNPKVSDPDKERARDVYRNAKDNPYANPNAKLYITYRDKKGELHDKEY